MDNKTNPKQPLPRRLPSSLKISSFTAKKLQFHEKNLPPSRRTPKDYRVIEGTIQAWGVELEAHSIKTRSGFDVPLFRNLKFFFSMLEAVDFADKLWKEKSPALVRLTHHNCVVADNKLWMLHSAHPIYPHPYSNLDALIKQVESESEPEPDDLTLSVLPMGAPKKTRRVYPLDLTSVSAPWSDRAEAVLTDQVRLNETVVGSIGHFNLEGTDGTKKPAWVFFPDKPIYRYFAVNAPKETQTQVIAFLKRKITGWQKDIRV